MVSSARCTEHGGDGSRASGAGNRIQSAGREFEHDVQRQVDIKSPMKIRFLIDLTLLVLNDVLDLCVYTFLRAWGFSLNLVRERSNRMDSGRFEFVSRPYSFHQVIQGLFVPLRLATDARRLELVTDLDPCIDKVRSPPRRTLL